MIRLVLTVALLLAAIAEISQAPSAITAERGLLDLDGNPATPFRDQKAKLIAFIFVRTDCPIANSYAPEIRRLHTQFAPRGVAIWLVYVDADEAPAAIRRHLRAFDLPCAPLRDTRLALTKRSRVRVTPEAALYQRDGSLLYHGRIDDRFADFGKSRPAPTRHDFADALTQALAGKSVAAAAGSAVGCFIEGAR